MRERRPPPEGVFLILETTARGGTPVVIAVVEIVPVELWLAVVEVQVRHPIRVVAGAANY